MKLETLLIKTPKAYIPDAFLDGIEMRITEYPLHACDIARSACLDGKKLIIAAGGDGTVNEVTNGIFDAEANKHVTLGIYISGSGNDFARSVGIFSEEDSRTALSEGKTCLVDVGRAIYRNFDGKPRSRIYCNLAGVGFDAVAAKNVRYFKKWAGGLDYKLSIVASLIFFGPKQIKIEEKIVGKVEGEKLHEEIMSEEEYFNAVDLGNCFVVFPLIDHVSVIRKYPNDRPIKDKAIVSNMGKHISKKKILKLIEEVKDENFGSFINRSTIS